MMADHWRTLRWPSWPGWQVDSNWASLPLFIIYVLVKPLCASLMLVGLYWAARSASGGAARVALLPFIYVSSACFLLVAGVTVGMTQALVSDQESYGMLKHVRISPMRFSSYLIGRGLARAGQAAVGALVTLGAGIAFFPEVRQALTGQGIAWGWLLVYLATGLAMRVSLGLILSANVLQMARYGMFLSEAVAGVLYLLSGAVFPIPVLPPWLQPLSYLLPPTYWLEGMRRALLGDTGLDSPFAAWGHGQLALTLAASTVLLILGAHLFFRRSEERAGRLGRYDEVSGN